MKGTLHGFQRINAGPEEPTDSNCWPPPIASDRSGIAGACTGLRILRVLAVFTSPDGSVLHRIALRVVSIPPLSNQPQFGVFVQRAASCGRV
jgi:hypothetical protein